MIIHSNGSTVTCEALDSVQELIGLLADPNYHLDPSFERHGGFFQSDGHAAQAFGSFADLSHVFSISGTHEEMLALARAIAAHKKTERYRLAFARHFGSPSGLQRRRALDRHAEGHVHTLARHQAWLGIAPAPTARA